MTKTGHRFALLSTSVDERGRVRGRNMFVAKRKTGWLIGCIRYMPIFTMVMSRRLGVLPMHSHKCPENKFNVALISRMSLPTENR